MHGIALTVMRVRCAAGGTEDLLLGEEFADHHLFADHVALVRRMGTPSAHSDGTTVPRALYDDLRKRCEQMVQGTAGASIPPAAESRPANALTRENAALRRALDELLVSTGEHEPHAREGRVEALLPTDPAPPLARAPDTGAADDTRLRVMSELLEVLRAGAGIGGTGCVYCCCMYRFNTCRGVDGDVNVCAMVPIALPVRQHVRRGRSHSARQL